jgi:DNA-binding transcriptional LysR family regulator
MEPFSLDLMDVQAFFTVVNTGSFARAAERLSTSKSVISRRVARLEDSLRVKLLHRTAKGAQTTDVGALYYAQSQAALAQLECASEAVAAARSDIAGPLRICGPMSFGQAYLSEALSEFAALYPRLELDIVFTDQKVDVIAGGFDVVLRIGALKDSSLIQKRLGSVQRLTIAAPAYLETMGRPSHPDDLSVHFGISYANLPASAMWRFVVDAIAKSVRVPVRLRADNGDMMLKACIRGLGVTRLPAFIAAKAIAMGQVEVILSGFEPPVVPLHALMPQGRSDTARVRALVDFLALKFKDERF